MQLSSINNGVILSEGWLNKLVNKLIGVPQVNVKDPYNVQNEYPDLVNLASIIKVPLIGNNRLAVDWWTKAFSILNVPKKLQPKFFDEIYKKLSTYAPEIEKDYNKIRSEIASRIKQKKRNKVFEMTAYDRLREKSKNNTLNMDTLKNIFHYIINDKSKVYQEIIKARNIQSAILILNMIIVMKKAAGLDAIKPDGEEPISFSRKNR